MSPLTPAERARLYRRRQGIEPRVLSDAPLARARRRLRRGAKVADLDPAEAEALRAYQREQARKRRTS
jgi:hypothetical protein